jgi:hypothetical protein
MESSLKWLYALNGSPLHKSDDLNEKMALATRFMTEALVFIKGMCLISHP